MQLFTRIRLVLAEPTATRLPGVRVSLYDYDSDGHDDPLGDGVTDAQGEVAIGYTTDQYVDSEDGPDWSIKSFPDLYVVVYDAAGQVAINTRDRVRPDEMPRVLVVEVPRAVAEQHGLLSTSAHP